MTWCVSAVLLVSGICFLAVPLLDYRIISLLLLLMVSLLAMMFDMLPVLIAAALSSLIWNFFFIPPLFTFHIDNTADILLFSMYFVVACINAVLTIRIRSAEKKARDQEEKEYELRLYNTLFNSLSHEMKTPLATILSAIDTARDPSLSEKNRAYLLDQIEEATLRMNGQVKNLLNMNRLESGLLKLKYDWCDVNELIILITDRFTTEKTHTRIEFHPDDQLPLCKLDEEMIGQSLQNIIQNACQYTPDGSTIHIKASFDKENLVISVSDNGPGVPPELLGHLFTKFYRLPQTRAGGTGLGLSIAKGFVEAHHGQISASLNTTGGLTITLTIPAECTYINHLKNEFE